MCPVNLPDHLLENAFPILPSYLCSELEPRSGQNGGIRGPTPPPRLLRSQALFATCACYISMHIDTNSFCYLFLYLLVSELIN